MSSELRQARPASDRWIGMVIFVVLVSVYFATVSGAVSTNDGSHLALVTAMGEGYGFDISPWEWYTGLRDMAAYNGGTFSDRPPGTALLTLPFYWLAWWLPAPLTVPGTWAAAGFDRLNYIMLAPVLLMAGAGTVFYAMLRRHLGIRQGAAVLTVLVSSLGSTMWRYGSLLYSHAGALFILVAVLYLLFEVEARRDGTLIQAGLLGLLLGVAPVVEYQSVIFSGLAGLLLVGLLWSSFWRDWRDGRRGYWLRRMVAFLGSAAIPLSFLLYYNTVNFGGPFELSMYHVDLTLWPNAESLQTQFSGSPLRGVTALLLGDWFFADGGVNQGLFLLSPITLLLLPGLILMMQRRDKRSAVLIFAGIMTVGYLILYGSYAIYNPSSNDSRYLTSLLLPFFIPVAYATEWVMDASDRKGGTALPLLIWVGLALLSVRNQVWHIALFWGGGMDLATLARLSVSLDTIHLLLAAVFPNAANLLILWAYLFPALALGYGVKPARQQVKPESFIKKGGAAL